MKLTRETKVALGVYLASTIAFASASGARLLRPTADNHFAYQAQMFLQRRLDLGHAPPGSNDWAEVEYLHLKDGRTVAGSFLRSQPSHFRELGGQVESIDNAQIENRWKKYYVSFPPFPAVVFMPLVAISGLHVNDVILTVLLAGFGPMLLFLALRRLRARGDSERSELDDLWLTLMFGLGTIYYCAAAQGSVWYTAHVFSVVLTGLFVLASLDAKHPVGAGLALGALVLTRPQMGFWGLFFLYELWRTNQPHFNAKAKPYIKTLALIGAPLVVFGVAGAAFNWARFHSISEFGHYYLNVRWTDRIQRYGLFNYAFIARNLSCAFTLTPKLIGRPPYVQISWHGMSLLLQTPAFVYVLFPRDKEKSLQRLLWLVVAPIALLGFMYQNDGWVQFGYRFSLDFTFAIMLLLAIGNRPITRPFKALILIGVAVNLFGAITFNRMMQFYHDGFFPIGWSEL